MAKPTDIVQYRGVNCSRVYARMLTMAHEDGVHFTLDSGFRSKRQQMKLWLLHKRYPSRYPVAAFPGSSTHNKKGWKQGLDINSLDGGATRVQKWAAKHGMTFRHTVAREPWHLNAANDYTHKIYVMWHQRRH